MLIPFFGATAQNTQKAPTAKKMLIAYYSHTGNTAAMAKQIQALTGADVFEIKPQQVYPDDYKTLTDKAKEEINAGYKPALTSKLKSFEQYDVIFVGSPCWWSTYAPPVSTFLSSYNFEGKTIIPFMTHGGSRMGRTVADIEKQCPKAKLLEALAVSDDNLKNSQEDVKKWLIKIGLIK